MGTRVAGKLSHSLRWSIAFQEFKMPHDIVVTPDDNVFVGDAASGSVFKFTSESKWLFAQNVVVYVKLNSN